MDKKQLTYVVLVVMVVAGALGMRHYFSKEQIIKRHLFEAVESFKNEKILGFMSKISRSYTDRWGGSYEGLGGQAQTLMDAYDGLTVDLDIGVVEVADNEARIGLTFVVGGRNEIGRGTIFGTELQPCRATLRWVKEQAGWRLVETEELDIPEYREQLEERRTR